MMTPTTYLEVICLPEATEWLKAIEAEHDAIEQTPTSCQSVTKPLAQRQSSSSNSRLMGPLTTARHALLSKGAVSKKVSTMSKPTCQYKSLRYLLTLTIKMDLKIHQMDMDSAFLQADLDSEIYVHQLEGFVYPKHLTKVWRLLPLWPQAGATGVEPDH